MTAINNIKIKTIEELKNLPIQDEFESKIASFLKLWLNESKYIETKTSGSTGKPKVIRLSKTSMQKSAELTNRFFNLKKGDKVLLCLPSIYIAGKMVLVRSLVGQLNIISVKPSLNPLKNINEALDFAAMTPMQVKTILKENPEKLNKIKTLIIGGAPVDRNLELELKKHKTKCYSTFGMTETITHIAVKELNQNNEFVALPTISFQKTNENCLVINAPHISNLPIETNDIVDLTSLNSFIWKGRTDNVINTGGIKVLAEEIEQNLVKLIPNNRFFITSEKDGLLGEKVILIIEGTEDLNKLNFDALDKFSKPKKVYYIPKFTESENGKILKQVIKRNLTEWEKK